MSVQFDPGTEAGLAFIEGHGYRIGQIGSFVRIPLGYKDLFGVVSQVGAGAVPEGLREESPYGHRWLTIQLVGEGEGGKFTRGVSQFPTVGDAVHLVAEPDLAKIYGAPDAPNFVRVGHLASAESIPALIDLNALVTRHSAVVGATGCGKSTTVAAVLRRLANNAVYPSARVVVLDVHGEYATALDDYGAIY
ncbi:MAG TPA: ATP-binding protein, partial [Nitrospira sp.]|nr:ATP-binding protein [Nitrospira sp.]